ncbi:hypothetical protein [Streptomyces sp. 900105245]
MTEPLGKILLAVDDENDYPRNLELLKTQLVLKGSEPTSQQQHIEQWKGNRIVLHSAAPFVNFAAFFKYILNQEVSGLTASYVAATDDRSPAGIWMTYGRYKKARGAPTKFRDALKPIDQGWGTMMLTAGPEVSLENLPESITQKHLDAARIGVDAWNFAMKVIQVAADPKAAISILAEKGITKKDFYIVISTSPWAPSVKGAIAPLADARAQAWRFGSDEPNVKTQVSWRDIYATFYGSFAGEQGRVADDNGDELDEEEE